MTRTLQGVLVLGLRLGLVALQNLETVRLGLAGELHVVGAEDGPQCRHCAHHGPPVLTQLRQPHAVEPHAVQGEELGEVARKANKWMNMQSSYAILCDDEFAHVRMRRLRDASNNAVVETSPVLRIIMLDWLALVAQYCLVCNLAMASFHSTQSLYPRPGRFICTA